ncbi:hypothetical protein BaRGS_00008210 [Batillaria attramentaria]|uniref:Uncharacterized protein n=1 Tax=Batillaria attramentaria TaxID=370345 RepID=A0ABD0LMG0_9CAEN
MLAQSPYTKLYVLSQPLTVYPNAQSYNKPLYRQTQLPPSTPYRCAQTSQPTAKKRRKKRKGKGATKHSQRQAGKTNTDSVIIMKEPSIAQPALCAKLCMGWSVYLIAHERVVFRIMIS